MVNDSSFLRVFVNSGSLRGSPFHELEIQKPKVSLAQTVSILYTILPILYDEYQHQNNYNVNNPTRTLVFEKEASLDEVFMQKNQLILQEPANAPHLPSYWDYIY